MLSLRPAASADLDALVALLEDALSSEAERRRMLSDPALASYAASEDGALVGAAAVRWPGANGDAEQDSEIALLAVDAARRGQGRGRQIVALLLDEARRRGVGRLLVGTGNFSLDNLAFYQKCGFRPSHVRRGFFDGVDPPEFWQGIKLRDMIVLDYRLEEKPTP